MPTATAFFKKGLGYIGALIVGGALTIGGVLTVTGASSFSTLTATTATMTNSVTTNATSTKMAIGSGKQLSFMNSAVASLTFGDINAGQCKRLTMTVTGATTSTSDVMSVSVGVLPEITSSATATAWTGFVSAADTVTIQGCNAQNFFASNLPAANFRATVLKFD